MTIDDNKEALAMMRRAIGSIENRFREAYNKGYHDGLKEGINQTTQKLVNKILEEVETEQTEPQNGYQIFNGTSVYVSRLEDEPQTDCPWK